MELHQETGVIAHGMSLLPFISIAALVLSLVPIGASYRPANVSYVASAESMLFFEYGENTKCSARKVGTGPAFHDSVLYRCGATRKGRPKAPCQLLTVG